MRQTKSRNEGEDMKSTESEEVSSRPRTRQRFMSEPAVTPLLPKTDLDSKDHYSKHWQEKLQSEWFVVGVSC